MEKFGKTGLTVKNYFGKSSNSARGFGSKSYLRKKLSGFAGDMIDKKLKKPVQDFIENAGGAQYNKFNSSFEK